MDNQLTHEINIHDYCGYPKVPAFITKMNENKIKCVEEASESSASPSPSLKQDSIDGDDRLMIVEEIDAPKVEPNLKKFKPNEIEVMSLNPINLDLLKKTTVKTSSLAPKEALPKFSQIIAKSENQEPLPQASTSTSKLEAYLATSSFKKGYINSYELEQERLRSPSQGSASDHSLSSGLYTEQVLQIKLVKKLAYLRLLEIQMVEVEDGNVFQLTRSKKFWIMLKSCYFLLI